MPKRLFPSRSAGFSLPGPQNERLGRQEAPERPRFREEHPGEAGLAAEADVQGQDIEQGVEEKIRRARGRRQTDVLQQHARKRLLWHFLKLCFVCETKREPCGFSFMSIKDYMDNVHQKSLSVVRTTIKVPGKHPSVSSKSSPTAKSGASFKFYDPNERLTWAWFKLFKCLRIFMIGQLEKPKAWISSLNLVRCVVYLFPEWVYFFRENHQNFEKIARIDLCFKTGYNFFVFARFIANRRALGSVVQHPLFVSEMKREMKSRPNPSVNITRWSTKALFSYLLILADDNHEFHLVSMDGEIWQFLSSCAMERDEWVTAIERQIMLSLQNSSSNSSLKLPPPQVGRWRL